MRFILDVHLGNLARHLRMMGVDALWSEDFEDAHLKTVAETEGRVLLTRDRALAVSCSNAYRVEAEKPDLQFREVVEKFELTEQALSGKGFLTRCLQCNSLILPVKGHQIVDRVPGHLLLEHTEFFLCPRCERVYWKGSHADRMQKWIRKTLGV